MDVKLVTLTDGFFRLVDSQCCFTDFKIQKHDDNLILEIGDFCNEYNIARHIIDGYAKLTKTFGVQRISFSKDGVTCPVSSLDSPLGVCVRYTFMAEVAASPSSS